MKAEILSPLDSSILSSILYEGLLLVRKECKYVDIKCLHELCDWEKTVRFSFTGNDLKTTLKTMLKRLNGVTGNKVPKNVDEFKNLMKKFKLKDLVIATKIRGDKEFLVGTLSFLKNVDQEEKYAFQIMKVDRYQGIASLELGLMNKQITVYADLSGLYLFFTGLSSSYVTTFGNDYYLLFFNPGALVDALENPVSWMAIKNTLSKGLRDILDKTKSSVNELIVLSALLNVSVIKQMEEENIKMAGFRLIRIRKEGNTYKVYEDIPLDLFTTQKIYQEKELITALQKTLEVLIKPASTFINGRDNRGDGYHAYMALRFLFNYVTTSNMEYLARFYRELHMADEISPNEGYLRWVLKRAI